MMRSRIVVALSLSAAIAPNAVAQSTSRESLDARPWRFELSGGAEVGPLDTRDVDHHSAFRRPGVRAVRPTPPDGQHTRAVRQAGDDGQWRNLGAGACPALASAGARATRNRVVRRRRGNLGQQGVLPDYVGMAILETTTGSAISIGWASWTSRWLMSPTGRQPQVSVGFGSGSADGAIAAIPQDHPLWSSSHASVDSADPRHRGRLWE